MSTSIEILRYSAATAASPELDLGITDMPTAQFDQLAERLLAEPPHPSVTPPQTEVGPLITARASTFATGGSTAYSDAPGPAGLNLNAALNPDMRAADASPTGYCAPCSTATGSLSRIRLSWPQRCISPPRQRAALSPGWR